MAPDRGSLKEEDLPGALRQLRRLVGGRVPALEASMPSVKMFFPHDEQSALFTGDLNGAQASGWADSHGLRLLCDSFS